MASSFPTSQGGQGNDKRWKIPQSRSHLCSVFRIQSGDGGGLALIYLRRMSSEVRNIESYNKEGMIEERYDRPRKFQHSFPVLTHDLFHENRYLYGHQFIPVSLDIMYCSLCCSCLGLRGGRPPLVHNVFIHFERNAHFRSTVARPGLVTTRLQSIGCMCIIHPI